MYQRGNQFDSKLNEEFGRLEQAINLPVDAVRLDSRGAAPAKPRVGVISYADGTNWNPGHGIGPYAHNGTTWVPLTPTSYTYVKFVKQTTSPGTAAACEGYVAYADGTGWNPGAGKGLYFSDGATWTKL